MNRRDALKSIVAGVVAGPAMARPVVARMPGVVPYGVPVDPFAPAREKWIESIQRARLAEIAKGGNPPPLEFWTKPCPTP